MGGRRDPDTLEAVLEHQRLLARQGEGGFTLVVLQTPPGDGAQVRRAYRGAATVLPAEPGTVVLLLPGDSATQLALALERASLLGLPAGHARYPTDGETTGELLRAARMRIGTPAPEGDRSLQEQDRAMLEDLPAGPARLTVLTMLSRLTEAPRSLTTTLHLTLELLTGAVAARRGFVLLAPPAAGEEPSIAAQGGEGIDDLARPESLLSRTLVSRVLSSAEPVLLANAAADPDLGRLHSVRRLALRSVLCVPVRDGGGVLGAIYLDHDGSQRAFTRQDLILTQAFARRAAGFLRRVRDAEGTAQQLEGLRRRAPAFAEIVGTSRAVRQLLSQVERVAASHVPVLITGPSGSGKELVARALHREGPRRQGPFIPVNCSAIPETLLESELFGHARGAFSGADQEREGLFEAAHQGTLFLDEVGDMSPAMQARLLRVLETRAVRRIGETRERPVDARVLAATHRDLDQLVEEGAFREDLLYRLRVVHLRVPGLAERPDDVPLLVAHVLREVAARQGRDVPRVTPEALARLANHTWPGNVRELVGVLSRALVFAAEELEPQHLPEPLSRPPAVPPRDAGAQTLTTRFGSSFREARRAFERAYLREVLETHGGVIARAARTLGMDRGQLSRVVRRLGLR